MYVAELTGFEISNSNEDHGNNVCILDEEAVDGGGTRRRWEPRKRREMREKIIRKKRGRNSGGACLFQFSFYSQAYHKRKSTEIVQKMQISPA